MESIKEVLTTIGQVVMATKIEALADSSNSRKELVLPEIDVSGCGISIFKNFAFSNRKKSWFYFKMATSLGVSDSLSYSVTRYSRNTRNLRRKRRRRRRGRKEGIPRQLVSACLMWQKTLYNFFTN